MFRTAFKNAARHSVRQSVYIRSASSHQTRALKSSNKAIIGATLAASALFFLPFSVVKNDPQPSLENTDLPKKTGGVDAEHHITKGKRNQPTKKIDDDQPETKVIPASSQLKKSEQPEPPKKTSSNKRAKITPEVSARVDDRAKSDEKEIPKNDEESNSSEPSEMKPKSAKDGGDDEAESDSEEGGQAAAFNPETGEINWDCPCLGGMAHGPCGEEFKAAFSCFVYSETEPKGIDCIEKFEGMRTCFKQHPEHYKEELYEDDEPVPSTESVEKTEEATVDIPKVA